MKIFVKRLIAIAMSATMLVSGAAIASAAEPPVASSAAAAALSASEGISPTATDEIYWKYRVYNGVLQKRRWNATKQVWVDPYWINVT